MHGPWWKAGVWDTAVLWAAELLRSALLRAATNGAGVGVHRHSHPVSAHVQL